jgi:hypothetical protein
MALLEHFHNYDAVIVAPKNWLCKTSTATFMTWKYRLAVEKKCTERGSDHLKKYSKYQGFMTHLPAYFHY